MWRSTGRVGIALYDQLPVHAPHVQEMVDRYLDQTVVANALAAHKRTVRLIDAMCKEYGVAYPFMDLIRMSGAGHANWYECRCGHWMVSQKTGTRLEHEHLCEHADFYFGENTVARFQPRFRYEENWQTKGGGGFHWIVCCGRFDPVNRPDIHPHILIRDMNRRDDEDEQETFCDVCDEVISVDQLAATASCPQCYFATGVGFDICPECQEYQE